MPGPDFFQTVMGHRFFESTMPSLVKAIEALNKNLGTMLEVEIAAESNRRSKPDERQAEQRGALARKIIQAMMNKGVVFGGDPDLDLIDIVTKALFDEMMSDWGKAP